MLSGVHALRKAIIDALNAADLEQEIDALETRLAKLKSLRKIVAANGQGKVVKRRKRRTAAEMAAANRIYKHGQPTEAPAP